MRKPVSFTTKSYQSTTMKFGRLPPAYSPESSSATAFLNEAQHLDRERPVWSASRLSVTSAIHLPNGAHKERWAPRSYTGRTVDYWM
eukprot:1584284-Prymnesium_polylepis.2